MKRLFLLCALLCTFAQTQANGLLPKFKFGIKAGMDYQSNNLRSELKDFKLDSSTGWFAGLQGELSFGNLGIHPEVIYSHNKFDVEGSSATNLKLNKLDIPVLLQYKLLGLIALQVGPTFCVMTETDSPIGDWEIKRPTVGYAAGAEVQIWKFTISARYNGSFKRSEVLGLSTKSENQINTFQLGVGLFF